jgi:hypothetical protein
MIVAHFSKVDLVIAACWQSTDLICPLARWGSFMGRSAHLDLSQGARVMSRGHDGEVVIFLRAILGQHRNHIEIPSDRQYQTCQFKIDIMKIL